MSYLHFLTPMPLADTIREHEWREPPTAPLQAFPGYSDPIRTASAQPPSRAAELRVGTRTDPRED